MGIIDQVKSVLIIEDDEALRNMLIKVLMDLQITKIDACVGGQEGFDKAAENSYDLIMLDWMVPEMTGLAVLNRIKRLERYFYTPVLVVSGMLKKKDFTILGDFPLCALIEKPFDTHSMSRRIQTLADEAAWYEKQQVIISQLVNQIGEGDDKMLGKLTDLVTSSPNPGPLAMMIGRFLRDKDCFDDAEGMFKIASQQKDTQLMALGELGKTYLFSGKNKEAKTVLMRVLEASPNNIERLCNLGNLSLKEMDTEGADAYFSKAQEIDKKDEHAIRGKNLMFNIKEYMHENEQIPASYASLLNAIGVSFVRAGDLEKGIEHYKSALEYIEDKKSQAKLSFNLGLGYAKWKKIPESIDWFEGAKKLLPDYERADHYVQLLKAKQASELPRKGTKIEEEERTDLVDNNFSPATSDDRSDDASGEEDIDDFLRGDEMEDEDDALIVEEEVDPKGTEDEEEESKAYLIRASPYSEKLFDFLKNEGVYLKAQLPTLRKLLAQYGSKTYNIVIKKAIDQKISSVVRISNMFAKHTPLKSKKEDGAA